MVLYGPATTTPILRSHYFLNSIEQAKKSDVISQKDVYSENRSNALRKHTKFPPNMHSRFRPIYLKFRLDLAKTVKFLKEKLYMVYWLRFVLLNFKPNEADEDNKRHYYYYFGLFLLILHGAVSVEKTAIKFS